MRALPLELEQRIALLEEQQNQGADFDTSSLPLQRRELLPGVTSLVST